MYGCILKDLLFLWLYTFESSFVIDCFIPLLIDDLTTLKGPVKDSSDQQLLLHNDTSSIPSGKKVRPKISNP